MNITYMIGNGFDIALGLKTQYSDFLKHYCTLDKKANPLLIKFQDEIRKNNYGLWSCAEKAFGEMDWSAFAESNPVNCFRECLFDFQREFEIYLKNQWKRFALPDGDKGKEISLKFLERMLHLEKYMGGIFARKYEQNVLQQGLINLRFIVFNYTDILEQIWATIPQKPNDEVRSFTLKNNNNSTTQVDVFQPCFVHGVFSRSKYLFGVDNSNQVKDTAIRAECENTGTLIKPYMDTDAGLGYDASAKELIESSDVIVTFGLSFGESDRRWWALLHQLIFVKGRYLVLCPYYDKSHIILNSGDAAMLDLRNELEKTFASLKGDNGYKLVFNRSNVRNIRLLDDIEKDLGNGQKTRCDYFDLHGLGKATVQDA